MWNIDMSARPAVALTVASTADPSTEPSWVDSCCIAPATPRSPDATDPAISEVRAGEAIPSPIPDIAVATMIIKIGRAHV